MQGDQQTQLLSQRLLRDISELRRKPYPNIDVHINDNDLTRFCLILSPPGGDSLHLTVDSLDRFPLSPPRIRMDSKIIHPNVFGSYICASILNTEEGYTPAYTLKSIAIQMLSFFSSENIEQMYGNEAVNLNLYRAPLPGSRGARAGVDPFRCGCCNFGKPEEKPVSHYVPGAVYVDDFPSLPSRRSRRSKASTISPSTVASSPRTPQPTGKSTRDSISTHTGAAVMHIDTIPNEILLVILQNIEEFEDLTNLAHAWPRVSRAISEFDIMRQRELQCFVQKRTYEDVNLGVGVGISSGSISSEFDLVSQVAYHDLSVRRSIHNLPSSWWLPLPISRPHWARVRSEAFKTLGALKKSECVKYDQPTNAHVIYQFMTDIIVKLNNVRIANRNRNSTLNHASDKAIESYFHLFHLLVCLATEDRSIVLAANQVLTSFKNGNRSKSFAPNLGHLIVAMLISDIEVTFELRKAIVTEAIVRNVVWTLRQSPELAYREPDAVSAYRLDKTFEASRTSYRLLMFSELFRRVARPDNKPLHEIREELFDRHGGPPHGAASFVAAEIRRLHGVNDFTQFMREMGFESIPTAASFTQFLRRTLDDSVRAGYSREALSGRQALILRLQKDSGFSIWPSYMAAYNRWLQPDGTLRLPHLKATGHNFFPLTARPKGRGDRQGRR
ncbi:hypothetical protein BJ166DRAFT_586894 [Pestalotiopsis sp. NC0098]|nr:hypothetical protein BJ166DRAFT_586894 [Pestalotiopsis sp. NC0098]